MQHLQKRGGGVSFLLWNQPVPNRADSQTQSSCKNAMSTGDGTSTTCPVAVRPPVPGSILKTTMLFENWFSASRYFPLGSIAKCRCSRPPCGKPPDAVSLPLAGSIEKTAMESWPRFEAKSHCPL